VSLLPAALAALARRAPDILRLTERWVALNSHSANVAGVNAVGGLMADDLRGLPLDLQIEPGSPFGDHLCWSTRSAREQAPWMLIGHHDTVFPAGTFEGFRRDAERAYGPGVLDMKGGLAVVAVVLEVLHELELLTTLPLCFVSVGDEEVGSPTSRSWLERLALRAQGALVFEAGRAGDQIVTSRRGSGFARVKARGRAAHAGNALADGRNAIWALSRFVDRVQGEALDLVGGSLSTGLVHGGSARNTVAEAASAECDLRFEDPEAQQSIEVLLQRCAREVSRELAGTSIDVEVQVTRRPLVTTAASMELVERYGACQRAAGLLSGAAPRQGGGSDANTVGAVGLPVIDGLGPRGRGYHTHDEQIEIASLTTKAEALLRFLLSVSSAAGASTQSDLE
jgi:glutamate carboxypeptidase